jgi:hypothetical protein
VERCGAESHEEEGKCGFALSTERIRAVAVGAHEAARTPRHGRNWGQRWSHWRSSAVGRGQARIGDFPWWALGQTALSRFDVGLGHTVKGVGPFSPFLKFQSFFNIHTLSNL